MGTRRKSRELVLQMLFQADMGKQTLDQVRHTFWAEHGGASAEVRGFADDLFRVATDRGAEIDKLIEGHAEHWRMDRMAAVDRNLLRAGSRSFWAIRRRRARSSSMKRSRLRESSPAWNRFSS
jgi:N utilization substance protein B